MNRARTPWRQLADILQSRHQLGCSRCDQIPLSQLSRNGRFQVCKLTGDRALCARIGALGLYPGAEAELINPANGSQCLLKVHGSRLCLDQALAAHILVATG